jgi:hypothetical protein
MTDPRARAIAEQLWTNSRSIFAAEVGNTRQREAVEAAIDYIATEIAAALHAARQATWEPIATAPKDRTRVICWGPNLAVAECEYRPEWYSDPAGWYRSNQSPRVEPTHWMPLPEAP